MVDSVAEFKVIQGFFTSSTAKDAEERPQAWRGRNRQYWEGREGRHTFM